MKWRTGVLAVLACLLAVACARDKETAGEAPGGPAAMVPVNEAPEADAPAPGTPPPEPAGEQIPSGAGLWPFDLATLQVQTVTQAPAHARYLNDPMTFVAVDVPEGQTAVVGYRKSVMYPTESVPESAVVSSMPVGTAIPIGAIIPILGKIEAKAGEYYGMYVYEDNYNYFYKTRYGGNDGVVWGADLAGLYGTAADNAKTSLYYKTAGKFAAFPPFLGYRDLTESEVGRLGEYRVAFQDVRPDEYSLSLNWPDDMLALYSVERQDKMRPIFVTTDLYANSMHLFFDKFLQHVEQHVFVPRLVRLVDGYLAKIGELTGAARKEGSGASALYLQTLDLATSYFQVAQALLRLAPEAVVAQKDGIDVVSYTDPDEAAVLGGYPEGARKEIALIRGAGGFEVSPLFNYKEDYSQYKPRGHYTANGVLSAYFRAMMWFGRIHIYVSAGQVLPTTTEGSGTSGTPSGLPTAKALSENLAPVAFLVTEISRSDRALKEQWVSLFDPITQLIGKSDDLSLHDLTPFWEGSGGAGRYVAWLTPENVRNAVNRAHVELRQPLIFGNAPMMAPSEQDEEGNLKPPMGWRLFGQRFTYDSFIHQRSVEPMLHDPRFDSRNKATGLEVMKVFGSAAAEALLGGSEYGLFPHLKDRLDLLERQFQEWSPGIWSETYYSRVLYLIKTQAMFEPGAGYYFTQTPAWGIKALQSAHGTWAALRHDTILYVKQAYGERSGDGDFGPTFRTEPLPKPVHYLEPNLAFYEGALAATNELAAAAERHQLADEGFARKIKDWRDLLTRSVAVVKLEQADRPVSAEDLEWIATIPERMCTLVVNPGILRMGSADQDNLRGAIIADVFTDSLGEAALEVGLGIPNRMYVALNDGQGGKRIAVGYTFSYYEFYVPMSSRMTNEEWRREVYGHDSALEGAHPFWLRGVALPPR